MARYKHYDYGQMKMLPVSYERQILPGTFEHTPHYLIDEKAGQDADPQRHNPGLRSDHDRAHRQQVQQSLRGYTEPQGTIVHFVTDFVQRFFDLEQRQQRAHLVESGIKARRAGNLVVHA